MCFLYYSYIEWYNKYILYLLDNTNKIQNKKIYTQFHNLQTKYEWNIGFLYVICRNLNHNNSHENQKTKSIPPENEFLVLNKIKLSCFATNWNLAFFNPFLRWQHKFIRRNEFLLFQSIEPLYSDSSCKC